MIKVMTIVGTRPEIIRLSEIIKKLDIYTKHILVHTGQNYDYELNEIFFHDLNIRTPDVFLNAADTTPLATIANILREIDKILEIHKPDSILILGDTNSSLCAIAAKRRKIPIFHYEAGNRCYDYRVPEEINRKIVDHISDINLTYSQIAKMNLIREGIDPQYAICIGSPMKEVINVHLEKVNRSKILENMNLVERQYLLVSVHREENVDDPKKLNVLLELLDQLSEINKQPIVVSTHPRTKKRIQSSGRKNHELITFSKPFSFTDYLRLQIGSRCVLSDSGTITEESSILNFPAINLREEQERQEGFEVGAVMFTGFDKDLITDALSLLDQQGVGSERSLKIVSDYIDENISEKIIRIILSYTSFINRRIWKKDNASCELE